MTMLDLADAATRLDRLVTAAGTALTAAPANRRPIATLLADLDRLAADMRTADRLAWCPLCTDNDPAEPAPLDPTTHPSPNPTA